MPAGPLEKIREISKAQRAYPDLWNEPNKPATMLDHETQYNTHTQYVSAQRFREILN